MQVRQFGILELAMMAGISVGVWSAYAHEGHHHHAEAPLTQTEQELRNAKFRRIGDSYLSSVKPIFRKSCFDCHSNQVRFPWYYKVPGAKQLIDHDIRESKEHLDFSNDYPFKGHGTPEEDLDAIVEVVEKGTMPPFRYRFLHSDRKLTPEDRKAVLKWARESAALLKR